MRSPTQYKFRHYRRHPEHGKPCLIWASDGPGRSEEIALGEIVKGSRQDLEVVRSQLWTPNALVDEGEADILDVYFDDVAVRTTLYFGLFNDGGILDTDTLATLTNEVSGAGYARIAVARGTDWSNPALDAGDMQTTSTTKTFSATGTWTAASELVLATSADNTGLFIAWAALSATRNLVNGDTLDVTLSVKLA